MAATTSSTQQQERARVVIAVRGRFDGSTVGHVRAALHAAIEETSADILVDVHDVGWIDLPALAVLADAHRRLRVQDRRLVLSACSDQIRRVLAVTRLNRVIPVERGSAHLAA
jgi:anti-sigma B factor antagonist